MNIEKQIVDFEDGIKAVENRNNKLNNSNVYDYYFSDNKSEIFNLKVDAKKIFENKFKTELKPYITNNYDKVHPSSSIYLNSYVNLKAFMAKEKKITFYALYRLAMEIKNKREWKLELEKRNDYDTIKIHDKILVCQSLNGSYITSILSTLLKIDVLIFDKIGPINKLYSRPNKIIAKEKGYIVISDLVCLGTEVKIAKNITIVRLKFNFIT